MAQFTLNWDNAGVLAEPNAIGQRAAYRRKDVGGAFITTGFTPANDMATSINSATSPNSLLENVVYEFKVSAICTENGPTDNNNGIVEQIIFSCILPDVTQTDVASTITLDVTGLNITQARFTLRKQSDNSVVNGPTIVAAIANSITKTATGLTPSTGYYWQVELYATINGVEVVSSSASYLNAVCGPYNFNTDAATSCPAPEDLVVSGVEL